jgi:hypothetical protein
MTMSYFLLFGLPEETMMTDLLILKLKYLVVIRRREEPLDGI